VETLVVTEDSLEDWNCNGHLPLQDKNMHSNYTNTASVKEHKYSLH
jgi:hypothetical protein